MSRDDVYSTHAKTIEAVIKAVCRRHRLSADRAEELASLVHLKLIDHDYAVLRQFSGRSNVRTYLITVAERVLLDWRVRDWGRWRPCKEARALGDTAIELDRLLTRERLSFEEACETLLSQGRATSRQELEDIRPRIAERPGRWLVPGEEAEHVHAQGCAPDEGLESAERAAAVLKTGTVLAATLRELPPGDQLILRLRFQDGFALNRIADLVGDEPKPFYRRFERLLEILGRALVREGITEQEMTELFTGPALELPPALSNIAGGIPKLSPSKPNDPRKAP